jgi:TPR repeat protein
MVLSLKHLHTCVTRLSSFRALVIVATLAASLSPVTHKTAHATNEEDFQNYVQTNERNPQDALKSLERAAQNRMPQAQAELARLYREGGLVKADMITAAQWYVRALRNGYRENTLHIVCFVMTYTGSDYQSEFVPLILEQAEANNLESQITIARMYGVGFGVKKDISASGYWFTRAQRTIKENLDPHSTLTTKRDPNEANYLMYASSTCSPQIDKAERSLNDRMPRYLPFEAP